MNESPRYFTTSFNPSGNRWIQSCGPASADAERSLTTQTIDIGAKWVVGSDYDLEVAILRKDNVLESLSFGNTNGTNVTFAASTSEAPLVAQGHPLMPIVPPSTATALSGAIPTPNGGLLFVNATNQQLTQLSPSGKDVTSSDLMSMVVDPLVDAHITYSVTNQLWALYARATNDRYVHGILGDSEEAVELVILKWNTTVEQLQVHYIISLEDENDSIVFEQLAPMWADVDGDGVDDLVTTIAQWQEGAALRVYFIASSREEQLAVSNTADSPFIGLSGRWLHQLAVGPLGPNGETELVEIRTPHIGGIVRYYRYNAVASQLDLVARTTDCGFDDFSPCRNAYTSHVIRSRNIDQVTVGDFNGDGIPELVVQTQTRQRLVGLQRCENESIKLVWSVPLAKPIESNIAVSCRRGTTDSDMDLYFGMSNQQTMRLSFRTNMVDGSVPLSNCTSSAVSWANSNSYILLMCCLLYTLTNASWKR